jgi:hypothetical protein
MNHTCIDLFEEMTNRHYRNMERRISRLQKDFWYLRETSKRCQINPNPEKWYTSQQLDMFSAN